MSAFRYSTTERKLLVRLTSIGNVLSGIGITLLGVAIGLKYLLESLGTTGDPLQYPFFIWLGSLILLGIAGIVFSSFTGGVFTCLEVNQNKQISNDFFRGQELFLKDERNAQDKFPLTLHPTGQYYKKIKRDGRKWLWTLTSSNPFVGRNTQSASTEQN